MDIFPPKEEFSQSKEDQLIIFMYCTEYVHQSLMTTLKGEATDNRFQVKG